MIPAENSLAWNSKYRKPAKSPESMTAESRDPASRIVWHFEYLHDFEAGASHRV